MVSSDMQEIIMQMLRALSLISAVVAIAAGLAGAAIAEDGAHLSAGSPGGPHVMTIQLPDGSAEQLRYWGGRVPVVTFDGSSGDSGR